MIWSFSFAQQFTNYSTKDSLPSNHIYRITQDSKGFIWFITDKGIVKYNGTDFKTFTTREGLPTNDIWNITATPNGKIWYFSKSPKIGYIEKDSVYNFSSTIKDEILNPMNRNIVNNEITFNNSLGHYKLENKQWKKHPVFGSFSKLKQYWTYLKHPKLKRFQFSNDTLFLIDKNNHILKKVKNIFNIQLAHTRGQINDSTFAWLSDKGFIFLNLNNFAFKTADFKDVIDIKKTKYARFHIVNNQVQITGKGFVAQLDKNYDFVNTHYIPKDLKAHFSFIDKQGNVWVATFTNGVYKLPKSKINATYNLIDEKVGKVKKIDGQLITTVLDKGFYKYNEISKHFDLLYKESSFPYGAYQIKELDKKYFITHDRITTIHKQKKTVLKALKKHNYLNETARQLVYHKNYLYGNFTSGLNKLSPTDLTINKIYFFNGIRTFSSFKKELIIATSNGLKILKGDSITGIKSSNKWANDFFKKPNLSLNKLDDNTLLVGTDGFGAFTTDLEKITPIKGTEYLIINNSYKDGNDLWLATNKGVLHYQKENKTYSLINTYNENDGLLLKNAKSVFATKKNLLISSNKGIVTIPKIKNNNTNFLDIYISKANYNGKRLNKETSKFSKNNTVNFSISSIDFSEEKNTSFQYKLDPIQNKWINSTSANFSFTDLSPNKYTLFIKKNTLQKTYQFTISPLWYQTLIAKIAITILSLLSLFSFIYFLRKKELTKQAAKLNAEKKLADFELHALRSQMNPHFVFNSLNAIQYYITNNQSDLSEKYLVKFARLIRMFFDFSHKKEILLFEEIQLLKGYLEIEQMRFGKNFKFKFHIDSSLDLQKNTIPTMLLQPIVENAVNHGIFHNNGNGLIEIFFTYIDDKTYEINIKDDGVGIHKSREIQENSLKKQLKNGVKSTKVLNERITLLNQAQLWQVNYKLIDNSKDKKGTMVQLIFKKND